MNKRRRRFVGLALSAVGLALVFSWPRPSVSKINRENFDRIQFGMTSEEVEEILGVRRVTTVTVV